MEEAPLDPKYGALSRRVIRALYNAGIGSLEEARQTSRFALSRVSGLGARGIEEILGAPPGKRKTQLDRIEDKLDQVLAALAHRAMKREDGR